MKNFIYFLVFCFVCLTISYAQTPDVNGILYVKKGAAGNGSSWSNATGELADALKAAKEATAGTVKQIWVAGGTYYPLYAADFASTDNRDKSFVLVKDVQIYGGFAGWEATLADRRLAVSVNKTILSGDLGTADDYSDNCYHVMIAAGGVGTALVDGVTLMKGGTATGSSSNVLTVNGQGVPRISGGGIMMYGAAPAINNTTICSNKAIAGAGLYIGYGSSPVITNCIISGNYANISGTGNGGASFIYNSSPVFINVVVAGNNAAALGGAIMVSIANPVFYNSVIYGNGTAQPMYVISGSYNLYYSMVQGGAANTANHNLADTDPYFVNAPSYTTAPFTGGDYALQSASPVINMGNNSLYTGLSAASGDISGNPRVFNYAGGGTIDMGATEAQDVNGAGIIYVKKGSTGSGYSWADAMGEPADALYAAKAFNTQAAGKVKQVWVAAGTYYPLYQIDGGNTNSRLKSFPLLSDVKIYGHFAGTETSIGDRDLTSATNTSTLSGDIGVAGSAGDNAYHVVTGINALGTAVLDGFTISDGYADYLVSTNVGGTGVWNHWGGGIHLTNGASPYCSNLTIQNNYSGDAGGGVMVYSGSSPTFENVNFLANTSLKGGGVSVFSSSLTTINCTISGNSGTSGGGVFGYGTSYLTIKNTVINSNTASGGAAVYAGTGANITANKVTVAGNIASVNGGGFFLSTGSHNLTDVLISGNRAGYYGSALYNTGNSYKLTNVTIAGNRDGATGGVVYNDGSVNETINNSVIINNSAGIYNTGTTTSAITYSMIQGISANSSTHMLAPASPGFVNAPAYTTAPFTGGDYSLSAGSPLADGGSNTLYAGLTALSTDRAGAARVTAFASGGVIDIGAYESAMLSQSITVSNMGKTYGSADFAPGFTATSGLTVSYASADNAIAEAYQDASDGNSWKIKIRKAGTVQITASQSGNSTYAGAPAQTFTLTIAKAPLQVTARDSSKVYDAAAFTGGNGVTCSGFVNGDDSSSLGGTLSYSGTALNAVHAGTGYTIVPSGYSSDNYTFTYINGSLTITKAPLTVTARDTAKTYDGVAFTGNAGVAVTGWVNNETAALLSGTLSFSGTAQGAIHAGNNYSLIPAGYTAADYDITYVSGKLVINKKALTITAKDSVAVYNGNAFAGGNGITCTGFVNNEDSAAALTGTLAYGGTSQGAVNSGGYTIIPSGLSAANYTITYQNGQLDITPAALTVTAKDTVKTYNASAFTGGNGVSYQGFVAGENQSVLGGSLSYGGSSQGAVNTGNTYVITPGGYTAANYTISYVNGTLSINPKALTVTANDSARVYNGDVFAGGNGVTYSGFAGSENEAVLGGTLAYDGSAQGAAAVGLYEMEPKGLTAANYTITYVKGALSITAAPLTITAIDTAKTYDATAFSGGNGVTYTGFVNGEDAAVLTGTLVYGGSAQGAVHAGNNYTLAPSGLTGHNYHITFNPGTLTINKAGLTITAIDSAKTYDGVAFSGGNGVSYTGFKGTDDDNVLTGTLGYGGDAQTAKAAGTYDIVPKDVQAANYTITFVKGTLQITPAALTITAKDTSKTYDGNTFAGGNGVVYNGFVAGDNAGMLSGTLAYTGTSQGAVNAGSGYVITPSGLTAANYIISYINGTLDIAKAALTVTAKDTASIYNAVAFHGGNGVSYTGFVNNQDSAAALTGALSFSGTAQGAVNTGGYTIIPSGLSAANYTITYQNGQLNITPAALTVTAKDTVKTYDASAFTGGNGVSYNGFIAGEDHTVLSGSLSYTGSSQGAVNTGNTYVITPGGYTAANYTISYVNGTLSINPKALTVTANDSAKVYNGDVFAGGNGVTYSGFAGSENEAVLGGTLAYDGSAQGAAAVGLYEMEPKGLTAANYTITYVKGALSITAAPLTITAIDTAKTYDATAFSGGNGVTYTGFVNGEDAAVLTGTLVYGGNAQGAVHAGNNYTLAPSGLTGHNYHITFNPGTLTINKAGLTITAIDSVKTYDGVAFSGGNGVSYTGFKGTDDDNVLTGTLGYGGDAQTAKAAGTYDIVPKDVQAANYTITFVKGTLQITPAALTITAKDTSKTYDGNTFAGGNGVVYNGFVAGDNAGMLSGTLAYTGTSQGAVNAGSGYVITPSGLTAANYIISYINGTLDITKAALTVTAKDTASVYNATAFYGGNGVSYNGFIAGEDHTVLSGSLSYTGSSQGAVNTGNTYVITPGGYTAANYTISYVNGTLSINPKALTVTANDSARVYNGDVFAGGNGVTYSGFAGSENEAVLGGTLAYDGSAQGAAAVGLYEMEPKGLTAANYTITYVKGALSITAAPLTITAIDTAKTYDATAFSGGNGVTYTGFVNGEDAAVLTGTLVYGGSAQGAVHAGNNYTLAPSGLTGHNYHITFNPGTLTINKAGLTITAIDSAKTYDGVAFSGGNGVSYTGFKGTDDDNVLTGTLGYGGDAQTAKAAGTYDIVPKDVQAANYTITFVKGTLQITPAALTITAKDTSKTYDGNTFAGGNGVVYNGFVAGDNAGMLSGTLAYTGTSQGAVNAGGGYVITPSGLTAANYAIAYVNGTLSINPKALTVTANDSARVYNGDVFAGGNGVTYSGFAGSESEAVLGGTLAYDGSAQGAAAVGLYEMEPKGLTAANYTITYVKGALSITAAPLTITAIDTAKTYDGTAFSGGNGVTYTGFVNGEDAAVLTGTLVYGGSAQGAVHAGNNYTLAPSGLTGHNYHITFNPGTLTINKAGLTITAIDSAKTYDGVAFSGGNGVSYTGFKGTDDDNVLTGTLGYGGDAQTAKAAGTYDIVPKDVQAANYTITFVKGTLQITPAALTITAKDTSKTYDGNTFAGGNGVVYNGFVAGDNAGMLSGTLAYTGTSQGAVNAGGGYVITPSGLTAANYAITYVNGSLTIQKAGLTVTATDTVKTYNGIAFAGGNGVTYNGFVSGDNAGVLTGTVTYTGSSQGAVNAGSNYVIVPSGLAAANYAINYVNGALDITKAALTVKAKDTTKVYDATAFSGGNEVTCTGFVNNESAAVLTGSLLYGGSSQGAVNVGNSYVIEPSGLQAANYTITYVNGNLSVTQRILEVEALNDTVTYSGLPYNGGSGVHFTGFKGTDNAQVLGGSLSYSGTAQGAVNAGVYEITPGGYTSGNYLIQYAKGALRIEKAPLTVTADNKQRCFGLANPAFTVGYTGWVNGEGIAALSTQATANTSATTASAAGTYAIVPLGAAAANYAITYVNGSLTVYALPASTLIAVNGSVLCGSNGSLPLTASTGYNYQWLLDNNALAGGEAGTFTATQTGRYTAIATDANNCTAAAANSITVTRLLPATVAFSFNSYCTDKAVTFTNTSDAGASGEVSYTWNSGNGQTGNNKDARFIYATAGTYTAALTVTPVVCPSLAVTVTKNISIEAPIPGLRLEAVNTTAGLPTQVAARNMPDAAYTWMPATGLSNAYIYNPVVTIDEDREYQIQMDFPSGCTTTDNLRVTAFVQNTILVANVFTPNGDGQNDLLIANLRGVKQLRYFRVFNRAGKKLFETADAGQGWDGRYNGELQPLATYIWTAEAVDANGRTIHRQGSVTLLR